MNRNDRLALILFIVLILLGFGIFSWLSNRRSSDVTPAPAMTSKETPAPVKAPPAPLPTAKPVVAEPIAPKVVPAAAPAAPKKVVAPTKPEVPSSDTAMPTAPKVELHKELIPKDITIIRCYYSQEVTPPGATLGFDLDGSGFTSEFEKMITIESSQPNIHVKNLHLVTPNQIHGEMEVGANAETKFNFPNVLIKGLPVFTAPDPFAVIRPGDVLAIFFIQMEDNGRGGRFRVLTNLTPDLAKDFKVEPSSPGLLIGNLEPHLPYAVDGEIRIGPGVPGGEYGLSAIVAGKEAFHRNSMIRIVRPNVGQSGLIHGMAAEEPYHRPGDVIQLYLQGTGLLPADAMTLVATVKEFDMGRGSFTYISAGQMRFSFNAPAAAPLSSYTVTVKNAKGENVFEKTNAFTLIGANWIAGAQVSPPIHPGQKSTLKIMGRDFSPEFLNSLHVDTDETGITLSPLHLTNSSIIESELSVNASVSPGDYWLHLSADGKKISPPYGSIIKVEQ